MTAARDRKAWIVDGASGDLTPGFFRIRLVSGGPWVPCHVDERVPRDADGNVTGDAVYTVTVNGVAEPNYARRWAQGLAGEPIPEAEYRYLLALAGHAEQHEPSHPAANPERRIDLMRAPIPF